MRGILFFIPPYKSLRNKIIDDLHFLQLNNISNQH
jgi:hypothetical protein